jgi:hypothetical protein
MHKSKMDDHKNGVTTSRKGKTFKFDSPIPGVHIYSNVWPDSAEFFKKLETEEYWNSIDPNDGSRSWIREDYLDEEVGKKSRTCWVHYDESLDNALSEVVDSYLAHWNLDPHSRETLRITKFSGNGEFFGMHSDDTYSTPRTTSMVYYETDDYEGGELEFIHFGVKIKPKAGQLLIFPSAYSYEHKVNPVTGGGERITIVSFFNQMTYEERSQRQANVDFGTEGRYVADLKYILSKTA